MNEVLKKFLSSNGAKGGSSRSPAKIKASRANAEKARASLADRSPIVRKLEARGEIRLASHEALNVSDNEICGSPVSDNVPESAIVYDVEKWAPTPDEIP